jgi:hypothetical protein
VLHGYWQTFPSEQIKTGILADWMDTLEDWSHEQVVYALRKWRNDFPDKRPNPGHILGMMKDLRGRRVAKSKPATPEPQRAKPTPEEMEQRRKLVAELMAKQFQTNRKGDEL